MSDYLITTVCSADSFQFFAPMLIYSARRAYPEAFVRVYIRGKMDDRIRALLPDMKKTCGEEWEIRDKCFTGYPNNSYICSILRLLIPFSEMKGYKQIYITDVDFLMFRQNPTHWEYYRRIMKNNKQPYAAFRGAVRKPYRRHVAPTGWRGKHTRIVAASLMLNSKWPKKMKEISYFYRYRFKRNSPDNYDHHRPGTYREQDEVVLYRMIETAGLHTPQKHWYFVGGKRFGCQYRDIHLGDFRKARRAHSKSKMKKLLAGKNIKAFEEMENEPGWKRIEEVCSQHDIVRESLRRLRKYAEVRK